ncbi:MAG: A/G-specific adenine glycosylase [Proteobacteria bacterium]|nr:A/G-specific adenine glycosylase [Pseudomonadota bacterium]
MARPADFVRRADDDRFRRSMHRRLLAWFRRTRRDLPWRRSRDPYAIWVSEVMLQQTQVATVIPYFERFLREFPTVESLAAASDHAILKVWQGLGYYRRVMHLREAARAIVRDHGGRVPDDPAAFAALPGVGRYTCGAVLSIAFGRPLAALDGNAIRVISRWLDVTACVDPPRVRRSLWLAAEALVPKNPAPLARGARRNGTGSNLPGDWNQAIMELGSQVCLPRGPRCGDCPVEPECLAARRGRQNRIPVRKRRKPIPHIEVGAGIVWRRGRILLCKRPADAMLGGLWEFPGGKQQRGETIPECIRRELREECDLDVAVGEPLVDVTHTYTHLRVTLRCRHCTAGPGRVRLLGCDDARWVSPDEIERYPLPAADVRILEALAAWKAGT